MVISAEKSINFASFYQIFNIVCLSFFKIIIFVFPPNLFYIVPLGSKRGKGVSV